MRNLRAPAALAALIMISGCETSTWDGYGGYRAPPGPYAAPPYPPSGSQPPLYPPTEPPRVPWRLLFLRGWSHDEEDLELVFA